MQQTECAIKSGYCQINDPTEWDGIVASPFVMTQLSNHLLEQVFKRFSEKNDSWSDGDLYRWLEFTNLEPPKKEEVSKLDMYRDPDGRFDFEALKRCFQHMAWMSPLEFTFDMKFYETLFSAQTS